MKKKYVFIKSFCTKEGVIPIGTEIILFRGNVYMNGGMLYPSYKSLILNLIKNKELKDEYLEEFKIINNKI